VKRFQVIGKQRNGSRYAGDLEGGQICSGLRDWSAQFIHHHHRPSATSSETLLGWYLPPYLHSPFRKYLHTGAGAIWAHPSIPVSRPIAIVSDTLHRWRS